MCEHALSGGSVTTSIVAVGGNTRGPDRLNYAAQLFALSLREARSERSRVRLLTEPSDFMTPSEDKRLVRSFP